MAKTQDEQVVLMEVEDEMTGLGDEVMMPGDCDVILETESLDEEAADTTKSVVHLARFHDLSYLNGLPTRRIQEKGRIG